jgi:hypothetical protein
MRPDHKEIFFQAADKFTCWIGLREPNPLADKWIGRAGYAPKMEACKAKTADNPAHRFGGLVTDPTRCPEAFRPESHKAAVETWEKKFLVHGRLPAGFTRPESGPEAGLVRYHGQAIYADFDLMAINKASAKGEFLPTTLAEQQALFAEVGPFLNAGFRAEMIQHGAEFMWDKGVGARESEFVYWFGPGRKFFVGPSSMPKGGH